MTLNILIIEDEESWFHTYVRGLKPTLFPANGPFADIELHFEQATTWEGAQAALQRQTWHCCLVDLCLEPGHDYDQRCETELKQIRMSWPTLPMIVVTGRELRNQSSFALGKMGFNTYFNKTDNLDLLCSAVRDALQQAGHLNRSVAAPVVHAVSKHQPVFAETPPGTVEEDQSTAMAEARCNTAYHFAVLWVLKYTNKEFSKSMEIEGAVRDEHRRSIRVGERLLKDDLKRLGKEFLPGFHSLKDHCTQLKEAGWIGKRNGHYSLTPRGNQRLAMMLRDPQPA